MSSYKIRIILFFVFAGSVMLSSKLQAQDTCTPTVSVTPVKCFDSKDGTITVTNTTCGGTAGCYSGMIPVPADCSTGCTRTVASGEITVNANEIVCLQNNFNNGTITMKGGEVRICGKATIGSITFDNKVQVKAVLTILPQANVTVTNISVDNPLGVINNYGTLTINNTTPTNGTFINYGTTLINGDLNANSSSGETRNYGSITVTGNAQNSKIFDNRGTLTVKGRLQINGASTGSFNKCTLTVHDLIINDNTTLDDSGTITVSGGTLTMNSGSTLIMAGGIKVVTTNFFGNTGAKIKSTSTNCSLFSVTNETKFNGGFIIDGKISFCDKGTIEQGETGVTKSNGATLDKNGACKCNPPSIPAVTPPIFTWSGNGVNATGSVLSNVGPGTYTLTTKCGTCTSTTTHVVTGPTAITPSVVVNADKSVTLTVTGGTPFPAPQPPYTYAWRQQGSDVVISTESNPKNLPNGVNVVTVTDMKGCTGTTTVTILAECAPSVVVLPITCQGSNNGKITITDPGCTGATINWVELGSNATEISGLRPGDYTLSISCSTCQYKHTYTLTEPPKLTASATTDDVGQVTLIVTGGTPFPAPEPSYQYAWVHNTDPTKIISNDPNPFNLPPGLNTVTVTDSKGCTTTAQVDIPDNKEKCIPTSVITNVSCFGLSNGSIHLSRPNCPSAQIIWEGMPERINQWDLNALGAGVYKAHITCESCSYDYTGEVFSPALLTVQAFANADGSGSLLVAGGTGPFFYQWMLEGGTIESRDVAPTNLPPGKYFITVTDANGCQGNATVEVPDAQCMDDGAQPSLTIVNETCPGAADASVEISMPCTNGSVEPIYTWNGTEVINRQGSRLANIVAGDYIVKIQCGKCVKYRTVTVASLPAIVITPLDVNQISCIEAFDGYIHTSVSGATNNYNYTWSDGFKTIGNGPSVINLMAGDYKLTVTDQTNSKCVAVENFTLALPKDACVCEGLKVRVEGRIPSCGGQNNGFLEAMPTGGTGVYTYAWSTGETTKRIENIGPGWYSVKVTDSQGSSCYKRAYITVDDAAFTVKIIPSKDSFEICPEANEQIALEAVSNATVNFVWTPGGSTNKILLITTPGTYTVTATDEKGCINTASVTIKANEKEGGCKCNPSPAVSAQPQDVSCNGFDDGRVNVTITGGSGDFKYAWSTGSQEKNLVDVGAGSYSLSVTDVKQACVIPRSSAIVKEPAALQIMITGNPVVCLQSSTVLTATGSAGTYHWFNRSETTQSITVTQGGTYQVEVRNGLCSALSQPFQVQQQPDEITVFGNSHKICPGKSVKLTSSFSTNNVWSTGQTTRSIEVKTPGDYTVSVALGNCAAGKGTFTIVEADPKDCGEGPGLCEPQFNTPVDVIDQCKQFALDLARHNAQVKYTHYLEDQKRNFQKNYVQQCLLTNENFTVSYKEREHQYTLYYYDQSGNLVRTVPPQGVKIISDPTTLATIKQDRLNNARSVETEHDYLTTYSYNSFNLLLTSKLPDQGTQETDKVSNRTWYDELGRLVLSQSAQQYQENPRRYVYSLYDSLNRIKETGEVRTNSNISGIVNSDNNTQVFSDSLKNWLKGEVKYEVARTYFDKKQFNVPGLTQDNLRNRVGSVTYEVYDADKDPATYDYGTHYSYDIHGHAKKIVQDNPTLDHLPGQRYKSIEYVYDLISQNVLELHYQKGAPDQFFHRNFYDADNRLSEVWTSSDYIHWDRDAKEFYYDHGPLARVELGHDKVQGVDYAYTIQGWIKVMNSNTLKPNRDMGKDGDTGVNQFIPSDEVGYSLGYYKGDYKDIGNIQQNENKFLIEQQGGELENVNKNLFNGNISNMITGIRQFMKNGEGPLAQSFTYDQLHRLKTSKNYQDNSTITNNVWSPAGTATDKYMMKLTYDANGNIMTLKRNAHTSTTPEGDGLDDLIYYYENKANGYPKNTNKLISVEDKRNHDGDKELDKVDDIRPGQTK